MSETPIYDQVCDAQGYDPVAEARERRPVSEEAPATELVSASA